MVGISGTNKIVLIDTISYEDKLWLVPEWLSPPDGEWQTPARIVCIDGLPSGELAPDYPARRMLYDPMPKPVLDGETDTAEGRKYAVVERPDIRIEVGRA